MRKGFTLIELLAVILVLGVIALIAIPIVTNMIDQAKKSALMDSAYGVIDAGELYYSVDLIKNTEGLSRYDFEIKNKKIVLSSDNTKVLKIKGSLPNTGTLQIYSDGKSAVALCNDAYCACKSSTDVKVTIRSNCSIDSETGEIVNNNMASLASLIPAGTILSYMGKTTPEGYLACDGKTYNISEYPNLANQIKNEFGSYNYYGGNGSTTFAVPNLQGEFLRGYSANSTNSKTTGVATAEVGKHQEATVMPMIYKYGSSFGIYTNTNTSAMDTMPINFDMIVKTSKYFNPINITPVASSVNTVGDYIARPTNTSVLYCIKY